MKIQWSNEWSPEFCFVIKVYMKDKTKYTTPWTTADGVEQFKQKYSNETFEIFKSVNGTSLDAVNEEALDEKKKPCWKNYEMIGMKKKDGKEVPNCVPMEEYVVENFEDYKQFIPLLEEIAKNKTHPLMEAEYQGKDVSLGKVMKGDTKKYKVFVKNDKGNVVKVNFGDPNMEIKRDDPERRKSFRARHKCDTAKDKTTPRYWSCRTWSKTPVSAMLKGK